MAVKLVGKNAGVRITLLGPQDGVPGTGTPIVLTALAKSVRVNRTTSETDTTAIGDEITYTQTLRQSISVELSLFTPLTGEQFAGWVGYYCTLEYSNNVGITVPVWISLSGVITAQSSEFDVDGAQMESVSIKGGAN